MFQNSSRYLVATATFCGLCLLSGCGGGGSGSSVPTPTPTPMATPVPTNFDLNALITGATDPAIPGTFVTIKGRGSISEAELPASFDVTFFRDDLTDRTLRFAATSPQPLHPGQVFAMKPDGAARMTYQDTTNKRFFVAQSGTLRIDRLGTSSTGKRLIRFTLSDLRMVPDTTIPFNSAVGTFMLSARGVFSNQSGILVL